jgi:hypothetical protein
VFKGTQMQPISLVNEVKVWIRIQGIVN